MKNKKRILFILCAIVVLIVIAAVMFVIGRGHTVYFDNKTITVKGEEHKAFYKTVVTVDGADVAKLSKGDRGMVTTMGQPFEMSLSIIREEGGSEEYYTVNMELPYSMDGILINLPAIIDGCDYDDYLSEFIIVPATEVKEEEETDEFGIKVIETTTGADESKEESKTD